MIIARSAYQLFIEALDVFNATLSVHGKSPVLRSLLAACDSVLTGVDLGVVIESRRIDDAPRDAFTIRLKNGNFVLVSRGIRTDMADWYVSEDHLRDVADHPRRFIEAPWKLDLEWLRERVIAACSSAECADEPSQDDGDQDQEPAAHGERAISSMTNGSGVEGNGFRRESAGRHTRASTVG